MKFLATGACMAALALSVAARDDRILVNHAENANFCATYQAACVAATPANGVTAGNICEPGDYQGHNATTIAKVTCSIKNPNVPNQLSLLTQFVASVVGATPESGLPQDVC